MNQRNIDDEYYRSEDKIICRKGRTEAYILTMDSLNIYGPKLYKFGDSDKNYYFLLKSNAQKLRDKLLKQRERLLTRQLTKRRKRTQK